MSSRPRRIVPRPRAPRRASGAEWIPAVGPAAAAPSDPDGTAPTCLTLSTSTHVEVARAALRNALLDLDRRAGNAGAHERETLAAASSSASACPVEPDRWADEGGPLGRLYAGTHRLSAAEREAWECREYTRDEVQAAAGAYARALRRDGVELPAALLTVRVVVAQEAADRLPHAVLAAVQRDATRCCLEAFYPH